LKNSPELLIVVNYQNEDILERSLTTFPDNVEVMLIDGRYGLHGLESIKLLFRKKLDIDWLILIDEDVVFINKVDFFSMVKKLIERNIAICGVRDGGVLSMRRHNPYVPNTFFCIMNYRAMLEIYDEVEIDKNNYTRINEFSDDFEYSKDSYNSQSTYEPYYRFFLYYRRNNYNFFFLNAKNNFLESDHNTTIVYDLEHQPLLLHTWRSRFYETDQIQRERINKILNNNTSGRLDIKSLKSFKDQLLYRYVFSHYLKKFKTWIKNCLGVFDNFHFYV